MQDRFETATDRFETATEHLLKIKREDDHAHRGTVNALGIDHLRRVGQVVALFLEYIAQTEAELELGDELEEGHIEVATHAGFEHEGERLDLQLFVLAGGQIVHGRYAGNDVGTVIVETWGRNLQVEGHTDIARFHVLVFPVSRGEVAQGPARRPKSPHWSGRWTTPIAGP